MTRHIRPTVALVILVLGPTFTACSSNSIEGTYFGTAGYTVLILESEGQCGYTDEYDEDEGVQIEGDEDCSWSLSDSNLTFIGVSKEGSISGVVGDDGTISLPDQAGWSGEIYSKD